MKFCPKSKIQKRQLNIEKILIIFGIVNEQPYPKMMPRQNGEMMYLKYVSDVSLFMYNIS